MKIMKEKLSARLGIIPEIKENVATTSTIPLEVIVECVSNEDCPDQTKCEGNKFYFTEAVAIINALTAIGPMEAVASQSSIGAECDDDCPPGLVCDMVDCMCKLPD
jgi:hypothetical protein